MHYIDYVIPDWEKEKVMNYNKTVGSAGIHIDSERIDGNLRNAQKKLNMQIVADCDEYIPFSQGALRGSVNYPDGIYGGEISWNTPYAHYQYEGELYLTEDGRSFAEKNEKKYPTGMPLHQHTAGTSDHWFQRAKETHGNEWIDIVKKEVGKG